MDKPFLTLPFLLAILILLLSSPSCSSSPPQSQNFIPIPVWYLDEEFRRQNEWPLNHGAKDRPPRICLALSGGGIRSAAFSVGILRGLQNQLENIDVISAVSGGGYAVGWLYASMNSNNEKQLSDVFSEEEIRRLTDKSAFIERKFDDIIPPTVTAPLRILENVLNSLYKTESPYHATSESGHYGLRYANAIADTFLNGNKNILLQDLLPLVQKRRLPLFLLNAGIYLPRGKSTLHALLFPTVEFSPLRNAGWAVGNLADQSKLKRQQLSWWLLDKLGLDTRRDPALLHDAMSFSGAAIDYHGNNGTAENLLSTLGLYLGRAVALEQVPIWYDSRFIYLTDGGYAENLGAASLIHRRCSQTLIVDAEYDPRFQFGAFVKLKRLLDKQNNIKINIPGLEELLKEGLLQSKNIDEHCEGGDCRKKPFTGKNPIYEGTVTIHDGKLMVKDKTGSFEEYSWPVTSVKVTYVKLSLDSDILVNSEIQNFYPPRLAKYITEHLSFKCSPQDLESCQSPFPQFDTWYQSYSSDQMEAYIDLGTFFVQHYLPDWVNSARSE